MCVGLWVCLILIPDDIFPVAVNSNNKITTYLTFSFEEIFVLLLTEKQPLELFYKESCSEKFRKIHRKTPVPEFLF